METTQQDALAQARAEGAAAATKRALIIAGIAVAVLVSLLIGGIVLAQRARDQAPLVIEEIATERRDALEGQLAERGSEAQVLAARGFTFLYRLWAENPALAMIRAHMDAATNEIRLLSTEVNAAIDSPTRNLGALFDRGPTRVNAVLDHAIAVAAELKRLLPIVLQSLKQANSAFEAADASTIETSLITLDGLLAPLMGDHEGLQTDWKALRADVLAWVAKVEQTLENARKQLSGDALSDEFATRLRLRLF